MGTPYVIYGLKLLMALVIFLEALCSSLSQETKQSADLQKSLALGSVTGFGSLGLRSSPSRRVIVRLLIPAATHEHNS